MGAKKHQTLDSLASFFDSDANKWPSIHDPAIRTKEKLQWVCEKGHQWESMLSEMLRRQTPCQMCRRESYWRQNSLKDRFPKIYAELHPVLNSKLNVEELRWTDQRKVWWLCPKGHEYKTTVFTRTRLNTGCSFCAGSTSKPELRIYAEFDSIFSDCRLRARIKGIEVDIYLPEEKIGIEYDGSYWHENKGTTDRQKNRKLSAIGISLFRVREEPLQKISTNDIIIQLPADKNLKSALKALARTIAESAALAKDKKELLLDYAQSQSWLDDKGYRRLVARLPAPPEGQSLADEYPEIAKDWDYQKNHPLKPYMVRSQASTIVYWCCDKGHKTRQLVRTRVLSKFHGCPKCAFSQRGVDYSRQSAEKNPLSSKAPQLAAEWHPTKNKGLTPDQVSAGAKKSVWWLCNQGHSFKAGITNRVAGSGCPYCSGHRVTPENNLNKTHPEVAKTWCGEKNGELLPTDVGAKSGKIVWWKCGNGHVWKQAIRVRVNKGIDGCMECRTLAFKFPELAAEWHSTKNGEFSPNQVQAHSGKYVWWSCHKCGHEWETTIHKRTSSNAGCPKCAYVRVKDTRRRNLDSNRLILNTHPDIRLIWDYKKNAGIDLETIPTFCQDEVWFKCPNGKSYKQKVVLATTRKNLLYCPVCRAVHNRDLFKNRS
jgi:ribosomal protein S27E